ncbi:MAG: helix-turn-helix domain-containing protein [Streptosporangiaceae bacterium]
MAIDDRELGSRIAYWRERRGVTQLLLADRIGRSKSWIEKAEAGKRSANRLPVLLAICAELRIDLPVLIGYELPRDTRICIDDIQVELIRSALERYDAIRSQATGDFTVDIPRLRRQVSYTWSGCSAFPCCRGKWGHCGNPGRSLSNYLFDLAEAWRT